MSDNQETPPPVNDQGDFVFERFKDVKKSRASLSRLDTHDSKHADDRKLQKDMINGNRPYNAVRMKANGQAYRCNVNFREAESIRDMNAGAYWSMMNDVPAFIDVSFKDPKLDPTQTFLWSLTMGEEYTRILTSWCAWHYHVSLVIQEFLIPGIGAFHFTDAVTWKPKAVKRENMRFRVSDSANPEDITVLFIRDTMTPHALYTAIGDATIARKSGWNVDQVQRALVKKYIQKDLLSAESVPATALETMQQMFKNGEYGDKIDELENLPIVWLYVKEPDGMISEYIMIEDEAITDYLYKSPSKYEYLAQAVVPFFYTIGDGDVGSVRGLGSRMFGMVEYSNRLMCGIMDGAWLASSMVIQDTSGDNRVLQIERIGPITKLPASVRPIQSTFAPQFGQLAQVRSMLEMMQNNNNGVYKRQLQLPNGGMRTATEAQGQMERDTQFSGQQVGNFYIYWALLHKEILSRLLGGTWIKGVDGYKEREEFIKACVARGIPRELLKMDALIVNVMQSIGGGSNMMKKLSARKIHMMAGELDEIGRQNALIDDIASEVGYRRAARYVSNLNRNLIPTNETSVAMLENNDMANGQPVVVGVDQKHLLHALTHMQPLVETIQDFMQTAQAGQMKDPRQLLPFWMEDFKHIAEHADRMRNDPRYKGDVNMIDQALKQTLPVIKSAQAIAKSQNDQERQAQQESIAQMQQQPQMTPEMQLKLQAVQAQIQVDAAKAQVDTQIKTAKAQQTMAIKQEGHEQKMRIKAEAAGLPEDGVEEEQVWMPPVD